MSRQSVYNCLHILSDLGVLRRNQPTGSVARYETRVGDNHHHLVCRSCGAIVDVDCPVGDSPCHRLLRRGFLIDEAEVTYWGVCPGCAVSPQRTAPGRPTDALGAPGSR